MGRFIKERAELDTIEAEEAEARNDYFKMVNLWQYNGFARDRWELWQRIAERARDDYYSN